MFGNNNVTGSLCFVVGRCISFITGRKINRVAVLTLLFRDTTRVLFCMRDLANFSPFFLRICSGKRHFCFQSASTVGKIKNVILSKSDYRVNIYFINIYFFYSLLQVRVCLSTATIIIIIVCCLVSETLNLNSFTKTSRV